MCGSADFVMFVVRFVMFLATVVCQTLSIVNIAMKLLRLPLHDFMRVIYVDFKMHSDIYIGW